MNRKAARHAEAERNDEALLAAAKKVLALEGRHASVAMIAKRAGVGIASLYRRYRTKDELFQYLCELSLQEWVSAAEAGLASSDPWEGFADYIRAVIAFGGGSLGPIAGTISITDEMASRFTRLDELVGVLVDRCHRAGVLRDDVTKVDIALLLEQFGKWSLVDQFEALGRDDWLEDARNARDRLIAIALDGLRVGPERLPHSAPANDLLTRRWSDPTG
ncbi:helix-turn-helix domain-containing protein [Ensifer sp.]|uniref:TetR/AcrR family transcriptional regulator n=1 Tax=Ensifer sp. TaxID=1872086 RepID=UPI0028A24299|nr:helix-turn-helix domain-containing protein [Ensifer sp.]